MNAFVNNEAERLFDDEFEREFLKSERLNKTYDARGLVSEEVIAELGPDRLRAELIGEVTVKGRLEPAKVYRLA